ncbi:hypothetical protein [Rhodoferax saidenbachensis]|uniref:SMODS-associating 2TM beta-strand rich effector domain-containing protein n=1 Tax=Rhodoferax saidenbachensis TaxID=1484693 RepID=A0A1P8K6W8_9BURK|nr:hypothetical protein [Rhodoferax saidenbachensis]APW41748.1 hypothetical protein RS694_03735 [Rhodoferax saidenbachensis]
MLPVSLTYTDLIRLIKYCGYIVLVAAGSLVFFRRTELQSEPLRVIWQSVSTALAVPPLLILGLSKLKWKYQWLAWLMGKRMVHGLWWGELKTEFKPTERAEPLPPIPIAFVIKQSYFFLTIQSYTPSLPARSTLETMVVEPRSSIAQLQYVFEMRRMQDAEDKITTGYGDLRLTSGDKRLEGYYWTNSPTRGRIVLNLLSRDCSEIDSFADAEKARINLLQIASSSFR